MTCPCMCPQLKATIFNMYLWLSFADPHINYSKQHSKDTLIISYYTASLLGYVMKITNCNLSFFSCSDKEYMPLLLFIVAFEYYKHDIPLKSLIFPLLFHGELEYIYICFRVHYGSCFRESET